MKMENKNYVVIDFGDSDFLRHLESAADLYCKWANRMLLYWKTAGDIARYNLTVDTFLKDIEYIRKEICNKFIGEYIKQDYDLKEVVTVEYLKRIRDIAFELMSRIKSVSEEELKRMEENEVVGGEHLVIFFKNDEFDFKTF